MYLCYVIRRPALFRRLSEDSFYDPSSAGRTCRFIPPLSTSPAPPPGPSLRASPSLYEIRPSFETTNGKERCEQESSSASPAEGKSELPEYNRQTVRERQRKQSKGVSIIPSQRVGAACLSPPLSFMSTIRRLDGVRFLDSLVDPSLQSAGPV